MKKETKGFLSGVATSVLALTMIGTAAAAIQSQQATLQYNNIKINLDGQEVRPVDAVGNYVEPFIINGTTYLPVRAVGSALGLNVGWDGTTKTVLLTSAAESLPTAPFTISAGQYLVGEDIPAGKYNCTAVSGSGNFIGTVASLGALGLNEILDASGNQYGIGTSTYSNLKLVNGDTIRISGSLAVEFAAK